MRWGNQGGKRVWRKYSYKNVIDSLELSLTPASGGSDVFDFAKYLARADSLDEKKVDGTIFYTAHFKKQK